MTSTECLASVFAQGTCLHMQTRIVTVYGELEMSELYAWPHVVAMVGSLQGSWSRKLRRGRVTGSRQCSVVSVEPCSTCIPCSLVAGNEAILIVHDCVQLK